MEFRELEYFTAIVETKNLSKAAQRLYISQPTLTKFIQRLEKQTGLTLFERIDKQWELTFAGQRFLTYARQLLSVKRQLEMELLDIRKADTGVLRVGMPPFRCSFALPAALPEFHLQYPHVAVEVSENHSGVLDQELLSGKIDLAFFNLSSRKPGLEYQLLAREQLYAVLPKGHPAGKRALPSPEGGPDGIHLSWLTDETLLIQEERQRQGEYLRAAFRELQLVPSQVQVSTNIRAAVSLAARGYGAAFVSGSLLRHLPGECRFDCYALTDVTLPFHFAAAWRKGAALPPCAHSFIEIMRQLHARDMDQLTHSL